MVMFYFSFNFEYGGTEWLESSRKLDHLGNRLQVSLSSYKNSFVNLIFPFIDLFSGVYNPVCTALRKNSNEKILKKEESVNYQHLLSFHQCLKTFIDKALKESQTCFYAPASIDWGHIVLPVSVCLFAENLTCELPITSIPSKLQCSYSVCR